MSKRLKQSLIKMVEDIVVNATMEMIMDDNLVEYIADLVMELQRRENVDLSRFKEQLDETEKAINNMLNAIQQGIFNKSTKQRLDDLETVKSDLEVKIIQEEMQRPLFTREQLTYFIHRFRKLDVTIPTQRQRLIDSFVNAVFLYADHLVITFNYKEGCKTVSLSDIMASTESHGSDIATCGAPNVQIKKMQDRKTRLFSGLFAYLQAKNELQFHGYILAVFPFGIVTNPYNLSFVKSL